MEKLEQQKDRDEVWTMDGFRKELQNMKENTAYEVRLLQNPTKETFQTPRFPKPSGFLHSTGEALLSKREKTKRVHTYIL